MKALYKGEKVNIIQTKSNDDCLIEMELEELPFWFTLDTVKGIYNYEKWKKLNKVIGDLNPGKMYRWVDKKNIIVLNGFLMETE